MIVFVIWSKSYNRMASVPKPKDILFLYIFGKPIWESPPWHKTNNVHVYWHPCGPLRFLSASFVDEALGTRMLEEDIAVEHFRFHQQTQFGENPENSSQVVGENCEAVHWQIWETEISRDKSPQSYRVSYLIGICFQCFVLGLHSYLRKKWLQSEHIMCGFSTLRKCSAQAISSSVHRQDPGVWHGALANHTAARWGDSWEALACGPGHGLENIGSA